MTLLPPNPPDEDAALSMRGLLKVYGNLVAVADLSLDIPTGSFYGIVGPNGAGKTTMLTMATGLLRPDRGTTLVHGVDVWTSSRTGRARARQLLGVMPDGMRLLDKLSGPDFLTHVAMLHGLDRDTARERTTELIGALDLQDAAHTLIADYSAGMVKKVALASALIHGPRVVVLDEPFESVDPVSSANIRQILQDFARRGGTVILSSHVMATVQKLCTHVAVINHGRVLVAGTTEQVAAGQDLEDRFTQLVGGRHQDEGLSWLGN
jgi:ABC-2 type transport system ATP-binding protein